MNNKDFLSFPEFWLRISSAHYQLDKFFVLNECTVTRDTTHISGLEQNTFFHVNIYIKNKNVDFQSESWALWSCSKI